MHHKLPQTHNGHSRAAAKPERNSPNCHLEMAISVLILGHFQLLPFLCTFDININFAHLPRGTVGFIPSNATTSSFLGKNPPSFFQGFPFLYQCAPLSRRGCFWKNGKISYVTTANFLRWWIGACVWRLGERKGKSSNLNSPVSYPFNIIAIEIVD